MEVLLCLAEHAGEVVTRDEFSNKVWYPSVVSDYALTRCISELRALLGDQAGNHRFIETIPKRGYRLIAPVKPLDSDKSAQADPGVETAPVGTIAAGQNKSRLRLTALGVVLLVSALVATWTYWPDGRSSVASATPPDGIAVLPFVNLSPDPDHAFFAGGMHEEVLTSLTHIGDLRVISRSSMQAIAEEGLAVPEIGNRLGVSHVLEGSVRRSGDRVRVTVQLIDAASDDHLWAENYDRDLSDIFAIQSDIALAIADQLEVNLDPAAISRLAKQGTSDPAAYELYLEGRELLRQPPTSVLGPEEIRERLDHVEALFRAAIEQDPEFAAAHAALSYALLSSLRSRSAEEAGAHYLEAVESSRRAIRLDPDLAAGYLTLGKAYFFHGSGDAAWEQFQLAADVDPDDPDTLRHMFLVLENRGEYVELVQVARRAAAIEPNLPGHQNRLGSAYRWLGHMDRARDAYRRAWEEMVSNPWWLHHWLAIIARDEGDRAELRTQLDYLTATANSPSQDYRLFGFNIALGDIDAAEAYFNRHQEHLEKNGSFGAALIWTHRGESERAEVALKAYEHSVRNQIPRLWGSRLHVSLAWIELLRGQHEKALDHMEAAVEKGFRRRLLWRFGHPDGYPPIVREFAEQDRFRELQARIDADLARMRAELAELDALERQQ
jgi:TolB-like protein/DNA-binding winged helix-turn-helix (wHTH) protein/Tfp pilus assembly protein PilF